MKEEITLDSHPTKWIGILFKNRNTGDIDRVLKVKKNGKRYRVCLDSDNDFCRYVGFDYVCFRKNWTNI